MLKCEIDFINLVVLGNFNPSILTPDFLVKECGLVLPSEPQKLQLTPVQTKLVYDRLMFFADLGRFEIRENECADPKSSRIPDYLKTYLKKLPYTPLFKCGANFSCKVVLDNHRLTEISNWLKNDRAKFRKLLKADSIILEITFMNNNKSESISGWILRTKLQEFDATTMMCVNIIENQKIKVDFNYEVGNIEKDHGLTRSIIDNYTNVVDLFNIQADSIFGE